MQMRKFGTPMAIAALFSCIAMSSANADTVTTTTTTVEDPTTVTTTSTPGSVVYLRTAAPTLLVTTIETRRKDIDKMIDQAYDRHEINDKKREALKRELKRIAEETGTNTITYPGAVMLAQDLDLIGTQCSTVVTTGGAYVPIITGSHFTVYNGQVLELDDLSVRRADLESRVTKDLLAGRLSDSRAAALRAQLAAIGAEAAAYQADGNLNFKEARNLYTDFDKVASEIEKFAGKGTY